MQYFLLVFALQIEIHCLREDCMTALLKTDYQDSDCDHFLRTRIRRRTQGDNIGTKMNLSLSLFFYLFLSWQGGGGFFPQVREFGGSVVY